MSFVCRICRSSRVELVLDLVKQPVTSHFLHTAQQPQKEFPVKLGICIECALLQLTDAIPAQELTPPFDWIVYNEPESHLDDLVEQITRLQGVSVETAIWGMSYKEDTTLERLRKHGFRNLRRLALAEDFGVQVQSGGMELIQERFDSVCAEALAARYGRPQIVIARHVIEHTHDTEKFITAMRSLIAPGGYLILEVPDCTRAVSKLDYSVYWEDHILYFTEESWIPTLRRLGLNVVRSLNYPNGHETTLVAITQLSGAASAEGTPSSHGGEVERAIRFGERFPAVREAVRARLAQVREQGKEVAIFGAGHFSAVYLNLLELGEFVHCVIDDHPQKRGLFMPGSGVPIVGSEIVADGRLGLIIGALGLESEIKVRRFLQPYCERGGVYESLFQLGALAE